MTEEEFLEFLEKNQNIIHKVCMIYTRSQAEHDDLFQEIVYQAFRSYKRFEGQSKLSTWLYRVALYTALAERRKGLVKPEDLRNEIRFEQLQDPKREYLGHLHDLIEQLKPVDRALILLFLEDKSYDEMADIMGYSSSNVGVRLNRIKNKMKELWNSKN